VEKRHFGGRSASADAIGRARCVTDQYGAAMLVWVVVAIVVAVILVIVVSDWWDRHPGVRARLFNRGGREAAEPELAEQPDSVTPM
jgi:hypothetical protein